MNPAHGRSTSAAMLERGDELSAIDEALARARSGSGALVVIEGEAGIGKSTILRAALERAHDVGLRGLQATASELEQQYPFGVAIALFEPLVRDPGFRHDEGFRGPAAVAAPLFGGSADLPASVFGDPFATIHGLYWLALNLAERHPLLLAVDDAQWADAASLRFLQYLAQRAAEIPIAMALAFRLGETATDEDVVRQLRTDRSATYLRPVPLSEAAVGELLSDFGEAMRQPALRHACWHATAGNPFFVTELIGELRRGDMDLDGGGEASIDALLPDSIVRFIEDRIARLGQRTRQFAEAMAVLDEEVNLRRAVTLARLSGDEAEAAVRELSRVAILAGSVALGFAHPIIRGAAYRLIPGPLRAQLHRDAARLLRADRAPVGVIAGHLMAAEPGVDPEVVDLLVEAARQARARGEPSVAIRQLERALEERPARERHLEVLLELARAEAALGTPSAIKHYDEILAGTRDSRLRASLLLELGHARMHAADPRSAANAFRSGIDELDDPDDVLTPRLEAGFVATAWLGLEHREMAEQIGERVLRDRTFGPDRRELALSIAFQRSISGNASAHDMVSLVRRVLGEAPIEVLVTEGQLIELATGVLFSTDALLEEIQLLDRAVDAIERAGSFAKVGLYSSARAYPDIPTGRLSDAIADAQAAIRAADLGWEAFFPAACAYQALAYIDRGDLAAAEDVLAIDPARWEARADWITVLIARGRLLAARGETREAVAGLRAAGDFAASAGFRNPGPPDWRTWLAVALTRLHERDEARSVAAEALDIARAWGAQWPIGKALRAAGIAEGGSNGIDLLREAVTVLERSPARLELARSLIDLGAALRRHGNLSDARTALRRGMDLAHRCGAHGLLERSREELRAAGSRPRRYVVTGVDALTPAEDRVARLAAGGRTNREIAQALFVTPKAVEYHLANAYRKLNIASRQQLKPALEPSA